MELFYDAYISGPVVYHAEKNRAGKLFICADHLTPYLSTGDYPLFDSADACRKYWEAQGALFA